VWRLLGGSQVGDPWTGCDDAAWLGGWHKHLGPPTRGGSQKGTQGLGLLRLLGQAGGTSMPGPPREAGRRRGPMDWV
jgi:hypothetical protein